MCVHVSACAFIKNDRFSDKLLRYLHSMLKIKKFWKHIVGQAHLWDTAKPDSAVAKQSLHGRRKQQESLGETAQGADGMSHFHHRFGPKKSGSWCINREVQASPAWSRSWCKILYYLFYIHLIMFFFNINYWVHQIFVWLECGFICTWLEKFMKYFEIEIICRALFEAASLSVHLKSL